MEFLHAVFCIILYYDFVLTYPMRAIIGEFEVYKILTFAKASVLIAAPLRTVSS